MLRSKKMIMRVKMLKRIALSNSKLARVKMLKSIDRKKRRKMRKLTNLLKLRLKMKLSTSPKIMKSNTVRITGKRNITARKIMIMKSSKKRKLITNSKLTTRMPKIQMMLHRIY